MTLDMQAAHAGHYNRSKVARPFPVMEFADLLNKLPEGTERPRKTSRSRNGNNTTNKDRLPSGQYGGSAGQSGAAADGNKNFVFDTETIGLNPLTAQLVGISISPAPGEAYYIPVDMSA